jgi:hypothetical protein
MLSALIVTWSVVTPQYIFSVIPHVPLYPIILTIGLGLLMFLVSLWRHDPTAPHASGIFSMLYALLVGAPFLATWVLCSRAGFPTWPAAVAGLLGPTLVLVDTSRHPRPAARHRELIRVPVFLRYRSRVLWGLASLFYGYGSLILAVFLLTALTAQGFGPMVVTHRGALLLIGAALSSGIFRLLHRPRDRPPAPANARLDRQFPELPS